MPSCERAGRGDVQRGHAKASPSAPLVAVVNTGLELIELLVDVLKEEGFRAIGSMFTSTTIFKRQEQDLTSFLVSEHPRVVVCDIAIPYEENWRCFRELEQAGAFT